MLESDKKEFSLLVSATLKTYRVEPDANVLRLWWGALMSYRLEQVRAGFDAFVRNPRNQFSVTPAHIIDAIEQASPDGRPGADEAWALYPHDEATSAVITDEIAEAMQAAAPLIEMGDRIGARMAFKDAYERIVSRNKAAGIPVRWFPSLGADPAGREMVISQAVKLGRLSSDHAQSLLPAPDGAKDMQQVLQLADKSMTEEQRERNLERMATIKAMLKGEVHVLPDSTDPETQLQRVGGK
jgi:hypothetical protein